MIEELINPDSCHICIFWKRLDSEGVQSWVEGACRKNPPDSEWGFPTTRGTDWCGEFSKTKKVKDFPEYGEGGI